MSDIILEAYNNYIELTVKLYNSTTYPPLQNFYKEIMRQFGVLLYQYNIDLLYDMSLDNRITFYQLRYGSRVISNNFKETQMFFQLTDLTLAMLDLTSVTRDTIFECHSDIVEEGAEWRLKDIAHFAPDFEKQYGPFWWEWSNYSIYGQDQHLRIYLLFSRRL